MRKSPQWQMAGQVWTRPHRPVSVLAAIVASELVVLVRQTDLPVAIAVTGMMTSEDLSLRFKKGATGKPELRVNARLLIENLCTPY